MSADVSTTSGRCSLLGAMARIPTERAAYMWVLIALPITTTFTQYVAPPTLAIKGQSPAIVLWLIGTVSAICLWVPYRRQARWSRTATLAIGLIGLSWLYLVFRIQGEGGGLNYSTYCVPVILALLALKPPARTDVLTGISIFCYCVVIAAFFGLLLDRMGIAPSGFVLERNGYGRLPFLSELLNTDARWDGPFQHSNYAGMIGGSVILASLALPRLHRLILVTAGALILLLSQSRTGGLATLIGLAIYLLFSPKIRKLRHKNFFRLAIAILSVSAIMTYILAFDPTLGLRTSAWHEFMRFWQKNPGMGIGTPTIENYFRESSAHDILAFTHAHDLFIDQGARYGLLLAGLSVVIFVLLGITSFSGITTERALRGALFGFMVAISLVEVPFTPAYISVLTIPTLLIVFLSAQPIPKGSDSGSGL